VKVLVTGASGFIGTHLLKLLASDGVQIATHGPVPGVLGQHTGVPFEDLENFSQAIADIAPDYIIHLAGVANAAAFQDFYHVNFHYAVHLFQALEIAGLKDRPVLLVGTAAEYGPVPDEQLPITEETLASPITHYGASKLAQTALGLALAQEGRPVVIARPFNVIGPGMGDHLSIQRFARLIFNVKRGLTPPVIEVGNLSSYRDFIDVRDATKAFWQLVQTPSAYGQIVNICTGAPVLIQSALDALVEISGVKVETRISPKYFRSGDVSRNYGSPARLQQLTGLMPAYPFNVTLQDIWKQLDLEE